MFDIYKSPLDEVDDWDDELCEDYLNGVMEAFAESPEGITFADKNGDVGWVHTFLYYGLSYFGVTPAEMSPRDQDEILFDLFPRKVSTEPAASEKIVGAIHAFWMFLDREYHLPQAEQMLAELHDQAAENLAHRRPRPLEFS